MGSFFILRCFLLFFFIFFNGAFAAEGKLWSRTEMVEMNGYGEQKLSSVIITGSLLCDPSRPHLHSIAIPGATVAIKCQTGSKRRSKWIKAVTDEFGEFEIDLPSQLHAIPNLSQKTLISATIFCNFWNFPEMFKLHIPEYTTVEIQIPPVKLNP